MILLISLYQDILNENLGLQQISVFLEERHIENKVLYINANDSNEKILDICINEDISLIGISLYMDNLFFASSLSKKIKEKRKIPIFYGSQFSTLSYHFILENDPYVDFIVLGQGEHPIYDFIEAFDGTNLEYLVSNSLYLANKSSQEGKKPYITDIKNLPWASHVKKIIHHNFFTYLNTSHGCMGNCSFCGSLRCKWSGRDPCDICNEIQRLHNEYGVSAFSFTDCSFEDPGEHGKRRLFEWIKYMKSCKETFAYQAFIRADSFHESDIELLLGLKGIGLNQYVVGIEAGNENDLMIYGKKAKLQDNTRTLMLLKKLDIFAFIGFIMINPYSTKKSLQENYNYLCRYHGFFPANFTNQLILYDKTRIFEKVKKSNQLIYLNNYQYDYIVQDKYVQALKDEFYPVISKSGMSRDMVLLQSDLRLIHFLFVLCRESFHEKEKLRLILEQLREINQQYYKYVYLDCDISLALKEFDDYYRAIRNYYNKVNLLKLTLQRKYLLQGKS